MLPPEPELELELSPVLPPEPELELELSPVLPPEPELELELSPVLPPEPELELSPVLPPEPESKLSPVPQRDPPSGGHGLTVCCTVTVVHEVGPAGQFTQTLLPPTPAKPTKVSVSLTGRPVTKTVPEAMAGRPLCVVQSRPSTTKPSFPAAPPP